MSTSDGGAQLQLPPSTAIEDELMQLRQYDGMTVSRLRTRCPLLLDLPVTMDELRRQHLADTDRPIAAHRVLTCGVQTLIVRSDFVKILSGALNVHGSEDLLDGRRRQVQAELHISEKAYRRLEDSAFEELAAALVLAKESPCGETEGGLRPHVRVALEYSTENTTLVEILTMLGFERRPAVRELYAERLLSELPEARSVDLPANQIDGSTARDRVRVLIYALLHERWPSNAVTLQNEPAMSDRVVSIMMFISRANSSQAYSDEELMSFENNPYPKAGVPDFSGGTEISIALGGFLQDKKIRSLDQFRRVKFDALTRLADLITRTERLNQWEAILRGSGQTEPANVE